MAKLCFLLFLVSIIVSGLHTITMGARNPFNLTPGGSKIEKFPVPKLKRRDMQDEPICSHVGQPCEPSSPNEDGDSRLHCDFEDGENCICSNEYLLDGDGDRGRDPDVPLECLLNYDGRSHHSSEDDSALGDEIGTSNDNENYGGSSTDEDNIASSTDEDYIASSSDEDYTSSNGDETDNGFNSDEIDIGSTSDD